MQSMTGYGRATREADGREITIEVKSVNHRFLDLSFRMPRAFAFAEDKMRKAIARHAGRGHFDISVTYVNRREDAQAVELDEGLLRAYQIAVARMVEILGNDAEEFPMRQYAKFPDVLRVTQPEEDREALLSLIEQTLDAAMVQLAQMRDEEGKSLCADMEQKLSELEAIRTVILAHAPGVVEECRKKLEARLAELLDVPQVDPQRVAQEVAVFADKCAIDEELVRLVSHIDQMRQSMRAAEPVGRRLDFLVQELNREVNTIGSKAQDAQIAACVIDAKGLIEKLREQVQNIE